MLGSAGLGMLPGLSWPPGLEEQHMLGVVAMGQWSLLPVPAGVWMAALGGALFVICPWGKQVWAWAGLQPA